MNYRDEFRDMLENTRISRHSSQEEIKQQALLLTQFVSTNIPNQLYKFRSCTENSLSAFEKGELWLSKASLFNDLHDSLFYFDKSAILEMIEKQFSSGKVLSMIEAMQQGRYSDVELQRLVTKEFPSYDTKTLVAIAHQSVSGYSDLLEQCFKSAKDGIRDNIKMVCLSESIKSPLMWAHYADNHKGFALGYDFRNYDITQCSYCPNRSCPNMKFGTIYPVIYSNKRYDATRYGQWVVQQYIRRLLGISEESFEDSFLLYNAALHKSKDWAYEKEWRIICTTINSAEQQKDGFSIKKPPVAIYFGQQIPDYYQRILTEIAEKYGIPKYRMYVKDYSSQYELDFEPI